MFKIFRVIDGEKTLIAESGTIMDAAKAIEEDKIKTGHAGCCYEIVRCE